MSDFNGGVAEVTVFEAHGWSKEACTFAGDLVNDVFGALDFLNPVFFEFEQARVRMMVGVVADGVAFVEYAFDDVGVLFDVLADEEEGC